MMPRKLGILNVGAGDTSLSFDPANPAEVERAKQAIVDMLRLGYAIMVRVGEQDGEPIYRRAKGFDPATCEYLIVGAPEAGSDSAEPSPRRRSRTARIAAASTEGVAVARSAGG